tara:strand:- start:3741 stop:4235 length:495 start_codon:yes stop_codon:yes gene_type:complete
MLEKHGDVIRRRRQEIHGLGPGRRIKIERSDVGEYFVSFEQNILYDIVNIVDMLKAEAMYDPIFVCYSSTEPERQVEICLVICELKDKTARVPLDLNRLWVAAMGTSFGESRRPPTPKRFKVLDSLVYDTTDGTFWNDAVKEDITTAIQKIKLRILSEPDLYDD